MKWVQGRQGGGYEKLNLLTTRFPIPWDLHLLSIPEGSSISTHTDPTPGYNHYRLNIIVRAPQLGGQFYCSDPIINWRRLKLFRPDIDPHGVETVDRGRRLLISIGWCIRDNS